MQAKVLALCVVALAVPALGPSHGLAQEAARFRVSDPAPIVGNVNHVPVTNRCSSGAFEDPASHATYFQTRGIIVFDDASERAHLVYRREYHTKKEMQRARRQALLECSHWLDFVENSP